MHTSLKVAILTTLFESVTAILNSLVKRGLGSPNIEFKDPAGITMGAERRSSN
jgi:hypothetical protein